MICGRFELDAERPWVMGILNVTPDSFSDGGRHMALSQALEAAHRMKEEGADIIDVGGESTRPGAQPVSPQQEADRVLPVLEALQPLRIPVSLDSRRPSVVRQALAVGIDLVNDVSGFQSDAMLALLPAIQQCRAMACVMHMQGEPQTMQSAPYYDDVVAEVSGFLEAQQSRLMAAGLSRDQILLDPGFGFGKTISHNQQLFRHLPALSRLGPVLVGVSRKRMIAELSQRPLDRPLSRLGGSLAAAVMAATAGARVLRVHDVRETADALRVWAGLK
ncbi:MAG: dihydropteroate synthase [Burkholderiaceae bacterium]|jgi:dihydropteroate synthase